jgi:hypothetical protein
VSDNATTTPAAELMPLTATEETRLAALFPDAQDRPEIHNFDLSDPQQSLLYVCAGAGDSEQLAELVGDVIDIVHYHARPVQFVRIETGELVSGVRCVLVDTLGRCYSTCSPSAIRTIGLLARTRPAGLPFTPPIPVKVNQQATASKRKCLILSPVIPAAPKAPAASPAGKK